MNLNRCADLQLNAGHLLDFWRTKLQNAPQLLEVPTDRPRPATSTYKGSRESRLLPVSLKTALKQLSKDEAVTPFMILLAAFECLLFRYTHQEDLVIGVPVAGRNAPETHPLIGIFVNTLALRTDLTGNPTFRELLRRVRLVSSEAQDHAEIPFEVLVEALKPDRTLAYSPLFQVMFAYQNAPREPLEMTGIAASPFDFEIRTSMFDLRLFVWEHPDGFLTTLEYSTDLFDQPTIQRLLDHFAVLLESVVVDPGQRLDCLPLLSQKERCMLLLDWNATEASFPVDVPLQQLIEDQAERRPKAIAVTFRGQTLSYRDLNCRANQFAALLQTLGVGPNVLVGVCLDRSVDLIVALLAIMKAGAAYVPLDPEFPNDRIALLIEDSDLGILVAEQTIRDRLPGYRGRIVSFDSSILSQYRSTNSPATVAPQHTAYVIYTSGSTGRPKGVLVSRGALLNLLWSMRTWFDLQPTDVFLGVTTISFDICGVDIWLPLLIGAHLILADRRTATDGRLLQNELQGSGVTFMQATPVTWKLLVSAEWQGKPDLKAICTGEAMPRELIHQLLPLTGRLWNMYGPTETTIWSTGYEITTSDAPVLIGRPIANTKTYILDESFSPVPIGVTGELYIAGAGLADGYINSPDLTSQRFVPNPFSNSPERLYRTGDLARFRADGNIECLGRNDHQIKLRGFRIEPDEIRAVIMEHPAVRDAIVVLNDASASGEKRIVAYVHARDKLLDAADLRTFLQGKLPVYMVPSTFIGLDHLPLTPNGKVDRRALQSLEGSHAAEQQFVGPRDTFEARLTKIWEDVLLVGPIGIRDNYFDLGGHSLLAVRLFSEIKKAFDLELPLATLYQAPTVESLAAILKQNGETATWSSLVPIRREGSNPPFYCVSGIGGGVLVFRDLAMLLGADQPVYGLQPKRLADNEVHMTRIADIAANYIENIQTVQPQGPYFLGGYSFGGLVAFEMAQQLTKAGHGIGLLAIFDQNAPLRVEGPRKRFLSERTLGSRRERLFEVLRSNSRWSTLARNIKQIQLRFQERLARRLNHAVPVQLLTLQGSQGFAAENYIGKTYKGSITLFRSGTRPKYDPWSYALGWDKLVGKQVEIHEVPGDHLSIYSGINIAVLATKLKACLEQARLNSGPNNECGRRSTDVKAKFGAFH